VQRLRRAVVAILVLLVTFIIVLTSAQFAYAEEPEALSSVIGEQVADPTGPQAQMSEVTVRETRTQAMEFIIDSKVYEEGDEAVSLLINKSIRYVDDGFDGYLNLASLQYEPVYRIEERQIERISWFYDLPEEDIIYLTRSMAFDIASDEAINSKKSVVLEMTAVEWTREGQDAAGRPMGYSAEVTYRGVERELIYDYVTVTAFYSGEVEKTVSVAALPQVEAPQSLELNIANTIHSPLIHTELDMNAFPFTVAAAAVAVLLLGSVALLLLFRYWNVRLIVIRRNGSAKTVLRKHVRLVGGTATLKIPDRCKLTSTAEGHVIRIRQSLVNKGGILHMVWRDYLLLRLPLEREIELKQR